MTHVFALATLLAATTAGIASADIGQTFGAAPAATFYAPDASTVVNPDADGTPALSGVEFSPVANPLAGTPTSFLFATK